MNFTMSENITDSIINEYECSPLKVTCAYIAPNAHIPDSIKLDFDKYKEPKILFVGKEWKEKGGETLLKAFIHISKDYPDVTLTIVGCSPDINIPNCNVVGRVPVEEVADYFSNATIFCLPTRKEAFGIVYLEAMAYSLPVIGSNLGAIPQFILEGHNGFVCEADNEDDFAEKIIKLIESPSMCDEFGANGRKMYLEKYTWSNVGYIMKKEIDKFL